MKYKLYDHCRISGSKELVEFLNFNTALAGGFHKSETSCSSEEKFPLTLSYCPTSNLVQVNEVINPEILFSEYFYKTGTINTLVNHFNLLAENVQKKLSPKAILEIGCNDFTFLKNFIDLKTTVVGVDPSDISKNNVPEGAVLYNDFFTYQKSTSILKDYGRFDVIFSSNSFAHIEDIKDVVRGIKNLLSENGVLIIEVHWLGSLIKNLQFPFIYHEHMYYYSLSALQFLLNQYNITIFDVENIDTHGGSIRIHASHFESNHELTHNVETLIEIEKSSGLYETKTFLDFGAKIEKAKEETLDLFSKIKKEDKVIVGYGASGQANSLMAVYGITRDHISYIVDDSPIKIGCFTPNNCIPIVGSKTLLERPPDYVFCLAYTFINEIIERNKELSVKWIVPLPSLEIIE